MAKSTKYEALKKIVRLNKKDYNVGDEVTGLTAEQEERLLKINAIAKAGEAETEDEQKPSEDNAKQKDKK